MADDTQVRVGVKGLFYMAPVGTTAPTDPYAPWGAGWVDLGSITEDGLNESLNENRQTFKAWGRQDPVRSVVTDRETKFKVTFMQTSALVLSLYYGIDQADMTSSGSADTQFLAFNEPDSTESMKYALGMDVFDEDYPKRIVVARAEVTEKGDLSHKSDSVQNYELTFSSLTAPGGASSITRMFGQVPLPS